MTNSTICRGCGRTIFHETEKVDKCPWCGTNLKKKAGKSDEQKAAEKAEKEAKAAEAKAKKEAEKAAKAEAKAKKEAEEAAKAADADAGDDE